MRAGLIRNHHQWTARVLRLVPGVEQLFLVALLRLVEQPPADPLDEAAREQGPARAPWPGQDRRLDRPQAPLAEMFEGLAIRIGDDEPGIPFGLRPVERERDLVGPCFIAGVPALIRLRLRRAAAAGGAAAGGGGGSAGGLSDADRIRTTVPDGLNDPSSRREGRGKLRDAAVIGDEDVAGAAGLICCGVADSTPAIVRRCAMAKLYMFTSCH